MKKCHYLAGKCYEMDVLYLSIQRLNQLRTICSDRLLLKVLQSFADNHKIVVSSKEQPSGLWCIETFLKEPPCHRLYKAFVFISFAFFGGFFQFQEGETVFGDMNVLKVLLDRGCILKEEYVAFVHLIYEARQENKPLKFDLMDEIENAAN